MTDLEITKACAEAMGMTHEWDSKAVWLKVESFSPGYEAQFTHKRGGFFSWIKRYDPLRDDAQAMALVKKFGVWLGEMEDGTWVVSFKEDVIGGGDDVENADLNRAICLCVARMTAARGKA